jgi:hypothetical protein
MSLPRIMRRPARETLSLQCSKPGAGAVLFAQLLAASLVTYSTLQWHKIRLTKTRLYMAPCIVRMEYDASQDYL